MTREEFINHMVTTHKLHRGVLESNTDLRFLVLIHKTDHESAISVAKGLADHQHSEFEEVEGIPANAEAQDLYPEYRSH